MGDAVFAALEGLGKADAAMRVVQPAVATIAKQMGSAFAASGKERVEDFLTGDAETDRLVMAGVDLANEMNSTTDWSAVPGAIMEAAYVALKAAAILLPIL